MQAGDQISSDWTLVKLVSKDAEGSHSWYEWCEQVRRICLSRFRAGFIVVLFRTRRTSESESILNSSLSVRNKDSTADRTLTLTPTDSARQRHRGKMDTQIHLTRPNQPKPNRRYPSVRQTIPLPRLPSSTQVLRPLNSRQAFLHPRQAIL